MCMLYAAWQQREHAVLVRCATTYIFMANVHGDDAEADPVCKLFFAEVFGSWHGHRSSSVALLFSRDKLCVSCCPVALATDLGNLLNISIFFCCSFISF